MSIHIPREPHLWICAWVTLMVVIFLSSCAHSRQTADPYSSNRSTQIYMHPCVDVQGHVLGSVKSNATVFLYQTNTFDLDVALRMVRNHPPLQTGQITATNRFNFSCLPSGQFVGAIPTVYFNNRTVGSPIVPTSMDENYLVRYLYQGGDADHMVGAFVIIGTGSSRFERLG